MRVRRIGWTSVDNRTEIEEPGGVPAPRRPSVAHACDAQCGGSDSGTIRSTFAGAAQRDERAPQADTGSTPNDAAVYHGARPRQEWIAHSSRRAREGAASLTISDPPSATA
jgi:hypothetical protein